MHTAAFDEFCSIRGTNCSRLAKDLNYSAGHLSDLRAGRRLVTPIVARELGEALRLTSPDSILWPATATEVVVAA